MPTEVSRLEQAVAHAIATAHGGRMTGQDRDGQLRTEASLLGYGRFGDAASKYADERWPGFVVHAQFAIEAVFREAGKAALDG